MDSLPEWPQTERLLLRPWRPEEADRLFDIRRREEVAKWLGDPSPWTDVSFAAEKIAAWHDQTVGPGPTGVWAITPSTGTLSTGTVTGSTGSTGGPRPLGTVSLGQLPGSDEIEIGWYLHPDSGGQGFAVEAAAAVLDRALSQGLERVWAIMWPQNAPSARVAASIGMTDLGVIDDPWYGTENEPTSRIFRAEASRTR